MRKVLSTLATVVSLLAPVSTQAKWIEIGPCPYEIRTQEGETLTDIAQREYGKPEMAQSITKYNPHIILAHEGPEIPEHSIQGRFTFFDLHRDYPDLALQLPLYPGLVLQLPDKPQMCVERLF